MKKILFSHSLLAKNKSALNGLKLTLASRLLYMSTEVANRAERVNMGTRSQCMESPKLPVNVKKISIKNFSCKMLGNS